METNIAKVTFPQAYAVSCEEGARDHARTLGWLPEIALVAAYGLVVVVAADLFARAGRGHLDFLYWLGLIAIVVPSAVRLLSWRATRAERIGLVCLVGLELYLVKVVYAPFTFLFADEFIHFSNVQHVLDTDSLFVESSLLPVTRGYPGLESITAALGEIGGLSPFAAGLLVVGAARLLAMVALYLLFEAITQSPRLAGLGALLYVANANFVFWSAQFSYESLALPLAVVAVFAIVRWQGAEEGRALWSCLAVAAILGVVVTHHASSYALLGYLVAATLVHAFLRERWRASPSPFALLTFGAIVAWLLFVAGETRGYLIDIFARAFQGFADSLRTNEHRALLTSESGEAAPRWEFIVVIASVAIMAVALLFALRAIASRGHLRNVHVLVLAAGAFAYLASLIGRLSPPAWEIANRASEFLFVGIGLMLAYAGAELVRRFPGRRSTLAGLAVATAILFMGGNMAGWPRDLRLPSVYRIGTKPEAIQPQGVAVAEWARARLGAQPGLIADEANRRLLVVRGVEFAYDGREWGVERILVSPRIDDLTLALIRDYDVRYVLVDRRRDSSDNMRGYYFAPGDRNESDLFPALFSKKFERLRGALPVADSGDIVVYRIGSGATLR